MEDIIVQARGTAMKDLDTGMNVANSQPVDWSKTNKISGVADQKSCNGDWALSAVEALESAIAIKTNTSVSENRISVQRLIDCDTRNQGCLGGWPARAWNYFIKEGMVVPDDYFYKQYLGVKRACLSVKGKPITRLPQGFRGRSYLTLKVD